MMGSVVMYFRLSSRVVIATAISGLVFTTTPSLAQTESSAASSTHADSDDAYESLMAEIDSVVGQASEPAEQESAPVLEPEAETRTESTPTRATAPPWVPSWMPSWVPSQALRERIESGANQILAWSVHLIPADPDRALADLQAGNWTRDAEIALLDLLVAILLALLGVRRLRGHDFAGTEMCR